MEEGNSDDEVKVMLMKMSDEVKQEEKYEEKPLICLIHRLISSDGKQNMDLTNSQINEILKKEFNIDTLELHELEGSIYLRLIKVFLPRWPEWDKFNEIVKRLELQNDYTGLKNIIQKEYKSLKSYLKSKLNITESIARENVQLIKWTEKMLSNESRECGNETKRPYSLEVHCTRARLNNLFYRQPIPNQDGTMTIFNIADTAPSKIIVSKPSIEGILNTSGISLQISLNSITMSRFTCHELSHILVNKKLNIPRGSSKIELNEFIQMKVLSEPTDVTKNDVLNKLIEEYENYKKIGYINAVTVLKVFIADILEGPETFKVPACYRKYMSKYAYKRYLYADLPEGIESSDDKNYDLQLKEMISPRYTYIIHDFSACKKYSFLIECTQCRTKYKGANMMSDLLKHYEDFHSQEPDVTCTNCNQTFTFDYLTDNRWQHVCEI